MSEPWLTLIGIGDNGLESLSGEALACLMGSKVIVVSERLEWVVDALAELSFAIAPPSVPVGLVVTEIGSLDRFHSLSRTRASTRLKWGDQPLILKWSDGYKVTLAKILELRGKQITILATGDPMHFGIGSTLLKHIEPHEMRIIPSPSAFSLAAARLGWPLQNVLQISLHGRAVEALNRHVYPGTRILALTSDASTVASVATILVERGFGSSLLSVMEHLGGASERIIRMTADQILDQNPTFADFNTLGIDCVASHNAMSWSPVSGLPDDAFVHDGQLTKREVRAATLSLMQPMPGQHLWDVGAGCGSISVEWMRAASGCSATAIETKPERLAMIGVNAKSLGVPDLKIIAGDAPSALIGLTLPDAIFIGGGITGDGVFDACWSALKPGGRLVANAVTLEGEAKLTSLRSIHGGEITRISVAHASPVGRYCGWKSLMPVTIWSVVKPHAEVEGWL